MKFFSLLDPLRDIQQEPPVCHCFGCGREIWHGTILYDYDGEEMCEECFEDWITDFLYHNHTEMAYLFGMEVRRV